MLERAVRQGGAGPDLRSSGPCSALHLLAPATFEAVTTARSFTPGTVTSMRKGQYFLSLSKWSAPGLLWISCARENETCAGVNPCCHETGNGFTLRTGYETRVQPYADGMVACCQAGERWREKMREDARSRQGRPAFYFGITNVETSSTGIIAGARRRNARRGFGLRSAGIAQVWPGHALCTAAL